MKDFFIQLFKNIDKPNMLWMSAVGSLLVDLIGGYDLMIRVLLFFIAADYISGMLAAGYEKKLNSVIGFKGIARKVMILMLVMVGHQADIILKITLIRTAVIAFYVANEIISILENADRMELKTPNILKTVINLLLKKSNPTLPGDEK